MDKFHECRVLGQREANKSKIAREVGLDRKTVRKYLESQSPPRYRPRVEPTKPDLFKEFEDFVRLQLDKTPKLSSGEIYAIIKPRGYQGSERTIQRRMKAWRDEKPKERFFEQEYKPGEQSQFDFKERLTLPFKNGPRVDNMHFGTLPHSNTCVIKGYPNKTYECFMDGVHSFFDKIGGITENVRIDNLSPCVKKVYKSGKRDYTESFERAIHYYNFEVLPCSPGKGNEKGDVERDIRTHVNRFSNHVSVNSLCFENFDELNRELAAFCEREQSEESRRLFLEEKKHLLPLIESDESILCRVETATVSPLGTIRVNKTTYSVPDEWIGSSCRVVQTAYEIQISRVGDKNPIVHERREEGDHSVKLEHVIKSLLRKPQAMVRWRHRHILFGHGAFEKLYEVLQQRHKDTPGEAEREFLRTLNLVQHVPVSEIACAVGLVLDSEPPGPIFEEVKSLLLIERRPTVIDITSRINQTPLIPDLKTYDQLIPKGANA
ncbi:MAG: IS21 family transposase [Pseudobdellovibrionaceae bacterium]